MNQINGISKYLLAIFMITAGIMHFVNPCTEVAKTKAMIQWADGRAGFRVVPNFVMEEWGIELPKERIW